MKRGWLIALATIILAGGIVSTSYAEVKLGGELRVRGVIVDNGDSDVVETPTDVTVNNGGFFEQRTRLNGEASVDENAKVFVQVQDSRKWGSEIANAKGDTTVDTADNVNGGIDLSQGYVEIDKLFGLSPVSVKMGRQAMFYGEHRLIGSLEWSNNARRCDALKFIFKIGDAADIDLWTAKVSEANKAWGNDSNFNGIYTSLKMVRNHEIDVYLLQKIVGSNDVYPAIAGNQTNSNFFTLGGRIKGDIKSIRLDYGAELATQFGDTTDKVDKSAMAYAARIGYTIPVAKGLRLGAEIDGASGDDNTTDDSDNDFDNLYPTNHYLYGFTDDVDWTNMGAFNLNLVFKPIDKLKLAAEYWSYVFNKKDSIAGNLDVLDNGSEINGKVNYNMNKKITL